MRRENFYKKLIQKVRSAVKVSRIPRSFSKKNNNVFSNEQHITMQVLMQIEKKKFRNMPAFLELVDVELELKRIPNFTTINKFSLRIKPAFIERLIASLITRYENALVAIDGTGFSLNKRSLYYCTIAGERKQFLQCVAAADLKRRLITAVRLRRKKRNENIDVPYLMKESAKQLSITAFLGDKLYDSKKNHELARKYGARFIAPLRDMGKQGFKVRGYQRRQLFKNFPTEIYNQRVLIENIFFCVKQKYGDKIYAKKFVTQKNEVLFRILGYNIEKVLTSSLLRALLSTSPY